MNTETIAIYVRVSTQEQAKEGYSVDEQLDRLRKYCEAHDWKLVKEYADPGFSGAKLDRPAITQLIKDVEEGKISRVLVYKLDRLSRSQKDTLYLIEDIFLKNGAEFVSMTENFDTSTPFGKAMIGILSVFAQLEREQIRERMGMGKAGRAKEGKWMGSWKPPIEYRYTDGELIVDPYEAEIIKIIFDRYASGEGVVAIANYLEKKGYKSSYGKIGKPTIYFILHNPVYIGKINYSGDEYEGLHDPIITEDLFNKCQDRFEKNKSNPRFASTTANFYAKNTFTGMYYCTCGSHMRVFYGSPRKDGSRLKYYACDSKGIRGKKCLTDNKGMIQAIPADERVLEEIRKLVLDPVYFVNQIRADKAKIEDKEQGSEIKAIKKRIADLEKQTEKLIRLYTIKNIDFDIVTKQIEEISLEKKNLEATLKEMSEDQEINSQELAIDETIEALKHLSLDEIESIERITSAGNEAKINEILHILIDKIVLTKDTIDIHWNF